MPQISVIVPVYNVEKYIHRCVDSILAQTFTDFELILVDDGSPDNCGGICDEYAQKDKRIRVIHKENGGLSSARNAGMCIAKGKYYLFCDSDDYVSSMWCEHFMNRIKTEQDNFIFSGFINVYVREDKTAISDQNALKEQNTYSLSDFFRLQAKTQIGYACNVLYYAEVLREHEILFPTEVIVEDLPFNLMYLKHMRELTSTGFADYYYVHDDRPTLSKKYYPNNFRRWQEKYQVTRAYIETQIAENEREELLKLTATEYLYPFLNALNNTFDQRNTQNFFQKIQYNIEVVNDKDFQHCLNYADTSREDCRYIRLLKARKYILAYLLGQLARIKRTIKGA